MSGYEDDRSIRKCITRLLHGIDRRTWDELPPLFTELVETDYRSLFGGEVQRQPAPELVATWRRMLAPLTATQHLLGPIDVEVDGAAARARCHVRAWHRLDRLADPDREWMVAGHYLFALTRADATWKIAKLTLETFYQTGNVKLLERAAERPNG